MRALLLILVGFGAGLAAGLLWRDAPDPPRRPVRTTAELPPVERTPPPEPGFEEQPDPKRIAPPPAEFAPTGVGTLEFDGRVDGENQDAWIEYRQIDGEADSLEAECDEDGLQRWRLRAGIHRLCWWHGAREDLRTVEVRIKPGEVTRVAATAPAEPGQFPIGAGLGRVEVVVFDLDNRRAPQASVEIEYVDVRGEVDTCDENVASDGSLRMDLLPGDYVVRVGCQEQPARIVAGQILPLVFRSGTEGEVRYTRRPFTHLLPCFKSEKRTHSYARQSDDSTDRYIYVKPGRYETRLSFPLEDRPRSLGFVDVAPGVVTMFEPRALPLGFANLVVRKPEGLSTGYADAEATPADPAGEPKRVRTRIMFNPYAVNVMMLQNASAGLWRVRITAPECDPLVETFEVGTERKLIEFQLQRSTIR